jgi:flagellar FliL protein
MAAKTEAKEAAPAPEPEAPAAAAEASAPSSGGGLRAWLPAIVALVLSPAATWAVATFLLIPKLEARLSGGATQQGEAGHIPPVAHKRAAASDAPAETYEFKDVVVNLAGTMGTRYLKCSFVVAAAEPGIKATFDARKAQLTDLTLNVLSSLTLADLEEPGAKNVLRERLVATYNQTLGRRVAEQVYFSDFVVQ